MSQAAPPRKSRSADRRTGPDRRKVDEGPPSNYERRRSTEARKPEVVEIEMTISEWAALNSLTDKHDDKTKP
jgi:hypothetical protein